jgi:hypothetical protein
MSLKKQMTTLDAFDCIAALSPDLRRAIDEGLANPERWQLKQGKLTDSANGGLLYGDDKLDEVIEQEAVNDWLRQAECLQLADAVTLQNVVGAFSNEWQKLGFESLNDLNIVNIHDSPKDLQMLWSCQQIEEFLIEQRVVLLQAPKRYDGGLLLIHGMGGCSAIGRLISNVRPRLILLFESDLDLIARQLNNRKEAEALLMILQSSGSTLFFITDTDVEKAEHHAKLLIEINSLNAQAYCFRFNFRKTTLADELNTRLTDHDAFLKTLRYLGFFVDELHMLMNGILTSAHTDARVLSYGSVKGHQRHAVIVASGPSLEASLQLLKSERERFDLICSFSTVGPLLKAGIRPDYHCHIERHADARFMQASPELEEFSSKATLLSSANVDPRLASLYKNTFTFLRSASSASALLASAISDIIGSEGSEAANAAIVFAVLLGYRKLHLFGVDFGAVDPSSTKRIEGALHFSERTMDLAVEGNLRETVWTSQALKEAAEWTGLLLNPDLYEPARRSMEETTVYNYSDGQRIPRTIGANPDSFASNLHGSRPHDCISAAILQTESKAGQRDSRQRVIGCDLLSRIRLQCQILRQLTAQPLDEHQYELFSNSCADRNTGSLIDQIITRLVGGTLSRVWIYLLILNRLIPSQAEAAWEGQCRKILLGCIDSMEALSLEMLEYSLALPNLKDHNLRSVLEEAETLEQI